MPSEVLGNAVIPVRAVLDKLDGDLAEARRKVEASNATLTSKMSKTGATLTRTLTPAAAAIGIASRQAFTEWDSGIDTVRVKTGATGAELDALGESLEAVGGKSTQGLGVVGEMLGDVAARTELTGKPLEDLTTRLLELERIGNAMSAESASRLFGDWGVEAEDGVEALDKLFRTSQATGVGVDRLAQLMVDFGAPMRQLGFDFDQSSAMLAKFEKEGVNTELVMGSMRKALGVMARSNSEAAANQDKLTEAQEAYNLALSEHGEDSDQAVDAAKRVAEAESALAESMRAADVPKMFRDELEAIKGAATAGEANAKALELFGVKAGPDMAAAIREGRFEIDDLVATIAGGEETIATAAADTADWGDKLAMLKNRAVAVVGPYGEMGMGLAGIAAGIGPVVSGMAKIGPGAGKAGKKLLGLGKLAVKGAGRLASFGASGVKAFASMSTSAVKSTVTVGAQVARQVAAWVVLGAQSTMHAAKVAAAWLISIGPLLLVGAAIAALVVLVIKHWDTIKRVTAALWEGIKAGVGAAWGWITGKVRAGLEFVKGLFATFTGPGLLLRHWDTIKRGAGAAFDWITSRVSGFVSFFTGIPGSIGRLAHGMFDGITRAFRGALNWIIDAWNGLEFRIPGFDPPGPGPKFGGFTLGVPNIPRLAMGGSVVGGGMVEVGEWGRELVHLPAGAEVMSHRSSTAALEAMAAAGGSSGPEVIKLYADGREIFELVRDRQDDNNTRNGRGRRISVR